MFILLTLVLIAILCAAFYVFYKKHFNYWKLHKNVPSVRGRILSGNLLDFVTFKTNFGYHLKTFYDDPEFATEPVVGIYGVQPSLLIRDPEIIKSVLIKDFECFCDRFSEPDLHHDPIGGQMLFFARYNLWKRMRSQLSPVFTSAKLKNMYPLIQTVGQNLERYLGKQPNIFRLDVKRMCTRYTTDIVATTVFGWDSNSLENPNERVHMKIRQFGFFHWRRAIDLFIIGLIPKLAGIFRAKTFSNEIDEFLRHSVTSVMAERERSGEQRNDIIDIFVKLKQNAARNGEDTDKLVELMVSQSSIFLSGGSDTSSTTIANTLLELAKNPDIQSRLRRDIQAAFEAGNGEISYEALKDMKYLDMIVNETMRLYPATPVIERKYARPSENATPYTLEPYCDFELPDGMPVYISIFGLHYDAKYWPNPTKYDPERFSTENNTTVNPMVYLPFGNGPHNCIGARLGMIQVKSGLIHLLRDHYVRVCDQTVLQPEFEAKATVLQVKGIIHLEIVRDLNTQ